ncbi:hypothetical protein L195_g059536 [Trifolium pratense]|uniref:Uncharacterized protein n=1 Tax=Trifolium pratense TaxID=57577 RepID=A0A2K3JYJ8_TRIPR|nr:hypothetical protein L195_g059536 [Trifolium pratense]
MGTMMAVRVEDGVAEGVDCDDARGGVIVGSIIFMVDESNS